MGSMEYYYCPADGEGKKVEIGEEKIDVNQYRSILQAIFTENNNILSSLDSPNRSNLHRMIRIYDFLEYGQKKTP